MLEMLGESATGINYMNIIKKLKGNRLLIECGFCEGTGCSPETGVEDEDLKDFPCQVCGGRGFHEVITKIENLVECKKCNSEGKKYEGPYFFGDECEVCNGKGFLLLESTAIEYFWKYLHPSVVKIAKALYDAGKFTEAAFSVIKNINSELKEYLLKKTGEELDGTALFGRLFSPEKPILIITDITSETGKNIQKGYMQILQGVFLGIRNPISHDQNIDNNYCIHILFLCSLIYYKLDHTDLINVAPSPNKA